MPQTRSRLINLLLKFMMWVSKKISKSLCAEFAFGSLRVFASSERRKQISNQSNSNLEVETELTMLIIAARKLMRIETKTMTFRAA